MIEGLVEREALEADSPLVGEMCSICYEEFKLGERTLDLSVCEHHFHSECIKTWLEVKIVCPFCKRSLL